MNNFQENSNTTQIGFLTPDMLSRKSINRIYLYGDQQMESAIFDLIDLQCNAAVVSRAMLTHYNVALLAEQMIQLQPAEESQFREIVNQSFRNILNIVERAGGRSL